MTRHGRRSMEVKYGCFGAQYKYKRILPEATQASEEGADFRLVPLHQLRQFCTHQALVLI
ncbi:hypothetical protein [Agrobacterium pusense]|uniref:hypothetical protein n=1 Tax=Agrobacterium pusense TaxID=648995 RepID=UPI002449BD0E|nr:hypothetical protein [Agrobacterium pusense]MDH0872712.1 hypothetical protein [Agrobacterium pusense]